jgi:putative colanic acid biosynthesis UDP-glucose lipid carrier transferase
MYKAGFLKKYSSSVAFASKVVDAGVIFFTLYIFVLLRVGTWNKDYTIAALAAFFIYYSCAHFQELYRSWRGQPIIHELKAVFWVWLGMVFGLLGTGYLFKVSDVYSRIVIGAWLLSCLFCLAVIRVGLRFVLRSARVKGFNTRSIALVGSGRSAEMAVRTVESNPWLGIVIVRRFLSNSECCGGDSLSEFLSEVRTHRYDQIWIAPDAYQAGRYQELVQHLADTTTSLFVIPDLLGFSMHRSDIMEVAGLPMVRLFGSPFGRFNATVKRVEDVFVAFVCLALCLVPMLFIALAVKLSSPGPIFFRQHRYGIDGKHILVWKFRTMTVCQDEGAVPQATRCDPRVTRVGAFLRKTSLDELPQFFNVLRGDMSVVGPRPHAVAHNEEYRKRVFGYMLRHAVKPGITGWAQINGFRGEIESTEMMSKRVDHDIWYIQNWSLRLDLRIILITIFRVLNDPRAY